METLARRLGQTRVRKEHGAHPADADVDDVDAHGVCTVILDETKLLFAGCFWRCRRPGEGSHLLLQTGLHVVICQGMPSSCGCGNWARRAICDTAATTSCMHLCPGDSTEPITLASACPHIHAATGAGAGTGPGPGTARRYQCQYGTEPAASGCSASTSYGIALDVDSTSTNPPRVQHD